METNKSKAVDTTVTILIWGGLWGIFEATAGYLLHLLPISLGWLVWYPAACFFMLGVYRATASSQAVVLVGLLAGGVKLLNLFLPGRIDRVLNPAVSIVFEALTLAAALYVFRRYFAQKHRTVLVKALAVICMNTGWRLLYVFYLSFFVPGWMREVSVIGNAQAFVTFFLIHNVFTNLVLWGGSIAMPFALRRIAHMKTRMLVRLPSFSSQGAAVARAAGAVVLLCSSIALELKW